MGGAQETGRDSVLHSERLYYQPWLWLMIIGLMALYAVLAVGAAAKGDSWLAVIFGAVLLVIAAVLAGFARLSFVITEREVVFGFGLVKKRFGIDQILSCEPYTLEFRNFYGYGIRSGRDGTIAYNTRNGPGVKMVVEGGRKPYVVSVNEPLRVCELLS